MGKYAVMTTKPLGVGGKIYGKNAKHIKTAPQENSLSKSQLRY